MKTELLATRCPKCNEPLPARAPQGLCAKCLLAAAAMPTEAGQPKSKAPAPGLEVVSSAFPQFEIVELIGQGGMGFVYKARQPRLDRFVALKLLTQSLAADPAFAERFNREARVLARLNHPNIVTVHDFGQAGGFFYLMMEFVDGVNLRQAMQAGRFTPQQAMLLVPRICEALQFAHEEGILHRDIKPENILLDTRGRVKIADFGIAKLVGEAQEKIALTASGVAVGTPHYMAPEQLEHPNDVDQRADIYSVGVVFYEMLTGELPIGRFEAPSRKSAVDERVDEVVFHALEKEREKRFRSAGEVKTSVEAITSSGARMRQADPATAPSVGSESPGERRAACFFNTPKQMRDCFPSAAARVFTCRGELVLDAQELTFVSPWRTTIRISLKDVEDLSVGQFQMWTTPWVTKYARVNFLSVTFRRDGELHTIHLTPVPPEATSASEINLFVGRWHERVQQAVQQITGAVPHRSDPEWLAVSAEPAWNRKGLPLAYAFALSWLAAWIVMPQRSVPMSVSVPVFTVAVLLFIATLWFCFAFLRANRAIWRGELDVVTSDDPPQAEPGAEGPHVPRPRRRTRFAWLNPSFLGAIGVGLVIPIGMVLWEAWVFPSLGERIFGRRPTAPAAGKLVLDAVPPQPGAASTEASAAGGRTWHFNCRLPPGHTARFLFVQWTNREPVVLPALSAYFNTGQAADGIDLKISCAPQTEPGSTNPSVRWNVSVRPGQTAAMSIPARPGFGTYDTLSRISVRSGHQKIVPLMSWTGVQGNTVDRVELRVVLEPLMTPAMRTLPSEVQLPTYVARAGLERPLPDTLKLIHRLPLDE